MPDFRWREHRIVALSEAIADYKRAGLDPDPALSLELGEHQQWKANREAALREAAGMSPLDPATCLHTHFAVNAEIARIEDRGAFMAHVHVTCTGCRSPFTFVGMPMGLGWNQPHVSVDRTEARLPILPPERAPVPHAAGGN